MEIYLIKNIEDEVTILDICTSQQKAEKLRDCYRKNFEELGRSDTENIITMEILQIDSNSPEVIWSYDE